MRKTPAMQKNSSLSGGRHYTCIGIESSAKMEGTRASARQDVLLPLSENYIDQAKRQPP